MGLGRQPALCSEGTSSTVCSRLEGTEQDQRKPTKESPKAHKHRQQVKVGPTGGEQIQDVTPMCSCAKEYRGEGKDGGHNFNKGKKTRQISILDQAKEQREREKSIFFSSALPFTGQTALSANIRPLHCAFQVGSWLVHLKIRFSKLRNSSDETNMRAAGPLPTALGFHHKKGLPLSPRAPCSGILPTKTALAAGFCLNANFKLNSPKGLVQILWAGHPQIKGFVFTMC